MEMNEERRAFLNMIAWSEIGPALLSISDNGYNIMVGSTPARPLLFYGYEDHPRIYNKSTNSTAAGRYQHLERYFDAYKKQLNLPDFGYTSQDAIALQQILECRAIPDIDGGRIESAIAKCAHIWASLPGNNYGQHANKLAVLVAIYNQHLSGPSA